MYYYNYKYTVKSETNPGLTSQCTTLQDTLYGNSHHKTVANYHVTK